MIWSVNANSVELGSLFRDNSLVCSRIYQRSALGHLIFWKFKQICLWISYSRLWMCD